MSIMHFDQLLDVSEFNCPMPLLKAKQALRYLEQGKVLKVIATDAGSVRDFATFIKHSEHEMLDMYELEQHYYYFICKN
ncbi:MAG: sulfurtransferase TusA family protein [Pseudomonadales bacterium]|nr:sulfurtransferase TusA family protein [Pseudomonadales bacterium]